MPRSNYQKLFLKIGSLILKSLTEYHHKYNPAGDIEEEYKLIRKDRGRTRAFLWYWDQILVAILQHICLTFYWRLAMLKNYLKIAVRNLKKQKGYSIINITGLAIGMACCILILLWVQDELGYDRFHQDLDNIFRRVVEKSGASPGLRDVTKAVLDMLGGDYIFDICSVFTLDAHLRRLHMQVK